MTNLDTIENKETTEKTPNKKLNMNTRIFDILKNNNPKNIDITKRYLDNTWEIISFIREQINNLDFSKNQSKEIMDKVKIKFPYIKENELLTISSIVKEYSYSSTINYNLRNIDTDWKNILSTIIDINKESIDWNVEYKFEDGIAIFIFDNDKWFETSICKIGKLDLKDAEKIGWCLTPNIVYKWQSIKPICLRKDYVNKIINHEKQHYFNKFLTTLKDEKIDLKQKMANMIKDEIIAQTISSSWEWWAKEFYYDLPYKLTSWTAGSYDYAKLWADPWTSNYIQLQQLQMELLSDNPFIISEKMKEKVKNRQYILAITPLENWKDLITIYWLEID